MTAVSFQPCFGRFQTIAKNVHIPLNQATLGPGVAGSHHQPLSSYLEANRRRLLRATTLFSQQPFPLPESLASPYSLLPYPKSIVSLSFQHRPPSGAIFLECDTFSAGILTSNDEEPHAAHDFFPKAKTPSFLPDSPKASCFTTTVE